MSLMFCEKVWKSMLCPTWSTRASMMEPPCTMRKRMSAGGVASFCGVSGERKGARGWGEKEKGCGGAGMGGEKE